MLTGDLRCQDEFTAAGHVDLTGARIGGQVLLDGADLQAAGSDQQARALTADRARIGGDLSYVQGSCRGTMSLVRTSIGGELTVTHGKDGLQRESALVAPGLAVNRDVKLHTGGTVSLSGAMITGDVRIWTATAAPWPLT